MLKIALVLLAANAGSPEPKLEYTLRFNPADTSGIAVEMRVTNAPASIQLAAHAHPEYDDKFWRYVTDISATDAAVASIDSVRWQVTNRAGDIIIRYRVNFPREAYPRAAWRPFLSATGGLVGGPHSFLYVIGLEKSPATVTLDIPAGWKVATGLDGKSSSRTFSAPNIHALMESPMLVGRLSEWTFRERGIPHRIFYWHLPNGSTFDSTAFVSGIQKLVKQTLELFGTAPYREYSFLFQDGAWAGGLEHPNSVTLGAPSAELAKNPHAVLREVAHEFVHTWNLMAIKPAAYREVDYRVQPPVSELWFSEGLTIYYGDLLVRRAGLPTEDSTRIAHLERLIERYLNMPGNARYSAEAVSRVAYNASPGALGDYSASSHLQGEILGTLFDFTIRNATDGSRSMDDVMRLLFQRSAKGRFTSRDVLLAIEEVCRCSARPIFDQHIFGAGPIDFNRYLSLLGLTADVSWTNATTPNGSLEPDLRAWGFVAPDQSLRLRVSHPNSVWGRADLHTGDRIVSVNGNAMKTWPDLRQFLRSFAIGSSADFVVEREGKRLSRRVTMSGYPRAVVRITTQPGAARQERLRSAWIRGLASGN